MSFLTNIVRRPVLYLHEFINLRASGRKSSEITAKCTYSRWVSREPSAIVNEDELYDMEDTTVSMPRVSRRRKRNKDNKSPENAGKSLKKEETKYKIVEASNKFINQIMIQAKSRIRREKTNNVIIEGVHAIRDTIEAGVKLKTLLFSKQTAKVLDSLNISNDVQLYQIPYKMVETWSTLATSPGIIGIFDAPDLSQTAPAPDALPLTVICDNVRDPRNLGSIIRVVAAVGCEKLILIKGCVDVWNATVQRCAASAQFRLPIEMYPTWEEVPDMVDPDARVYIADNHTYSMFNESSNQNNSIIKESTADNENSEETHNEETHNEETHNEETHNEESHNESLSNLNAITESTSNENKKESTHARQQKVAFRKFLSQLPIKIFYMPDYTEKEVILVVGGETEGFGLSMKKFLNGRIGERLHIPLSNDINSLNSATTVGILTYEIRRQYLMKQLKA